MNKPKYTYIYGLKDPRDGKFYYVGKSDNPAKRKKQHLKDKSCNASRVSWISDLQYNSLEPELIILEKVNYTDWSKSEIYWIAFGYEEGWPLVNIDHGDGRNSSIKMPDYSFMYTYVRPDLRSLFDSFTLREKDYFCLQVASYIINISSICLDIDKRKHYIDWDKVNDTAVYVGQRFADIYLENIKQQSD